MSAKWDSKGPGRGTAVGPARRGQLRHVAV